MHRIRPLLLLTGVVLIAIMMLLQSACKHDPIYTSVCFDTEVLPIFTSNCTMSGCHNATDAKSGVVLTNYDQIMASGIKAGKSYQSKIYKSITGKDNLMPPGGKLTDNQITFIRSWIEDGAKNTICTIPVDTTHNGCDTIHVTYTNTIKPIVDNNCLGCHGSGSSPDFSVYDSLNVYLNLHQQNFLNSIYFVGSNPMPPDGKLSDCNIKQFVVWLTAGHPNNK